MTFWRESDYEAQWREGVTRIADGSDTSCLVTVMTEPEAGQLAQFWTLYRFGDEVAVHEQLWVEPDMGPLYPEAIYGALLPYDAAFETENGERMPVSESGAAGNQPFNTLEVRPRASPR